MKGFKMCESVSGNWHYHLHREDDHPSKSLCGASTMHSGAPIDTWGFKPEHMPSSYCKKCESIATNSTDSTNSTNET